MVELMRAAAATSGPGRKAAAKARRAAAQRVAACDAERAGGGRPEPLDAVTGIAVGVVFGIGAWCLFALALIRAYR
jgi:hypothetical protein